MSNFKEKKQMLTKIGLIAYVQIFPILLFLSLEILNVPMHEDRYTLMPENFPAFIFSCFFIYMLILLIFTAMGNIFWSCSLVSLVLFLFYTVNFYRRIMTGSVMIPPDLNFVKQVGFIISFSVPAFEVRVIYSGIMVLLLQIPNFFAAKYLRLSVKMRIACLPVVGAVMFLIFFTHFSGKKIVAAFNMEKSETESFNHIYEANGALMGFYTLFFMEPEDAPAGYSKPYMNRLVSWVARGSGSYEEPEEEIKPNVIVVMSESFTDPARLPNVTYSQEPAPNLKRIRERETSGYIVTPSFGGMTCNPEYEFLTGNAIKYIGFGDTPYYSPEKYIDNSRDALPHMFKQNGYKTVGLHTNKMTFYDRDKHYPKLGFDQFIAEEEMPDAKYKGALPTQKLISDEYFMDKLLEIAESTEEPLFLYGITMQNHSTYLPDKYESLSIGATSPLLSEEDALCLETYVEGVHDADAQLGRLYDFVMSWEEPTIAVWFGDHLPIITHNTEVYTDLGYITHDLLQELTEEEKYKMYTTPYVAFSNYESLPDSWGDISPYFLGAILADNADIDKNFYYTFLTQAYERFHADTEELFIDKDDRIEPESYEQGFVKMFRAFQYDKLFGKNYVGDIRAVIIGRDSS